jgi:hypothetical protein
MTGDDLKLQMHSAERTLTTGLYFVRYANRDLTHLGSPLGSTIPRSHQLMHVTRARTWCAFGYCVEFLSGSCV